MAEGSWLELCRSLDVRVAKLKAEGVGPEDRADLTEQDRVAALRARSLAFQRGSQGAGKRMTYGTGKPESK